VRVRILIHTAFPLTPRYLKSLHLTIIAHFDSRSSLLFFCRTNCAPSITPASMASRIRRVCARPS
jgi:hypothetical protein